MHTYLVILKLDSYAMFFSFRYMGSGCSMSDLHIDYRIGISTISALIREVCSAIWSILRNECFPLLTEELLLESAIKFEQRANFPNCVAAVDGKHVRLIKPTDSGSLYYNYKNFFSILLLAMCDANYNFLYIDVGAPGKASDSTVFKNSTFYSMLQTNRLSLPAARPISKDSPENVPFVIVGDEAFGLSTVVMRPYGGTYLSVKKKIFNYRLSRARRYIECTFGILSNKWRIFHRPLNVDIDLAEMIIKVCCLLHNFVRDRDGYRFEDTLDVVGLSDLPPNPRQGGKNANDVRDIFANFFMGEGQLSWQMAKI